MKKRNENSGNKVKGFQIKLCIIAIFTVLVVISSVLLFAQFSKQNSLLEEQKQAIQELEQYDGEYDTQSLVLNKTNPVTAQEIAEKVNGKLRLSADGTFGAITLPEGVTVSDIYNDVELAEYLEDISLNFKATINDIEDDLEEYHVFGNVL